MVGMIPLLAPRSCDEDASTVAERLGRASPCLRRHGLGDRDMLAEPGCCAGRPESGGCCSGRRASTGSAGCSRTLFDPAEFLSPHGLRSLSAYHREHPYVLDVAGVHASIDYEPAESTTAMFGGNSNWRGPVWFPLNYLVANALERYHEFFGDRAHGRVPDGSGTSVTLDVVAADLWERLVSIFLVGPDGSRPCFGGVQRLQTDPRWRNNLLFNEYFHGDNGAGLGACHQTGWTGLVADVILRRHGAYPAVSGVIRKLVLGERT